MKHFNTLFSPRSVGVQYATGEEWGNAPERMKRLGQSRNHAELWVWSGGESKV